MLESYRITIEYTARKGLVNHPSRWDWHDLIAFDGDETVSFVKAEEIESPAGHVEYFKEFDNEL
jgi:hypothetical protein